MIRGITFFKQDSFNEIPERPKETQFWSLNHEVLLMYTTKHQGFYLIRWVKPMQRSNRLFNSKHNALEALESGTIEWVHSPIIGGRK